MWDRGREVDRLGSPREVNMVDVLMEGLIRPDDVFDQNNGRSGKDPRHVDRQQSRAGHNLYTQSRLLERLSQRGLHGIFVWLKVSPRR